MKEIPQPTPSNVTAADALRPFLREGEQIVWCNWEGRPSRKQLTMRIGLLSFALTAAPLLGLLMAETYRWYTIHEFNYPIYFMGFAILLGIGLTATLVHAESSPPAPRLIAITSRRVLSISFESIPVKAQSDEPFDLEVLSQAMTWLNFDEIDGVDVFSPTGHIAFKAPGQARVMFSEIASLRDVMSLLPERVLAKLDKSERQKLESHTKERNAH